MAEPMEMVRAEPQQIELRAPQGMMVERPPAEVLAEARKAAQALGDVISGKKKKFVMNGEQYLEFEDWQTLGHFYGVTAGEDGDPEHVTINEVNGFKASAVAYRHGQAISRATQYCMADEPNWRNKPLFQLSSMAQTRACAKVLRNVLAWVVVLAGYKPTPAEEMENLAKVEDNHPKASPSFAEKLKESEVKDSARPPVGENVGLVEKLGIKKSKAGKPYMIFTFNGKSVTVWDQQIFPFLVANENKRIMAVLEANGNYTNLIACRSMDEPEPEKTMAAAAEIEDGDLPF